MSKACDIIQNWEGPEDFDRRIQWMRHTKWILPAVVASGGPTRNRPGQLSRSTCQRNHKKQSKCHYCGLYGHTRKYCDTPHYKCTNESVGYCVVPVLHRQFQRVGFTLNEDCPYGGRQVKLDKGKGRADETYVDAEAQDQGSTLFEDDNRD